MNTLYYGDNLKILPANFIGTMKRLFCVILLSLGALLTHTAYGCTCVEVGTSEPSKIDPVKVRENLRRYYLNDFHGALFTGTVIKIETVNRTYDQGFSLREQKVSIRVEKYWLGVTDQMTVIYTGMGGGDCGVTFEVGKQYLFMPRLVEGRLIAGTCDYNSNDSKLPNGKAAAKFDEVLGEAKKLTPEPKN